MSPTSTPPGWKPEQSWVKVRSASSMAEDFAYMSPVFLFDMGVIVLFVGASSGELNLVLITEGLEVIVDKL